MGLISDMWHTIGGGDVGGPVHDLWDNFTGAQQAHDANETSINLANTAVQRRKADLTAAGFNPLLAVGNPADTPGIRSLPSLGQGAQQAFELYKTYGASQLQRAQTQNLSSAAEALRAKARKDNADAETAEQFNSQGGGGARADKIRAEIDRLAHENNLTDAQASQAEAMVQEIRANIGKIDEETFVARMRGLAEKMDVKAKRVAYEVLLHTAVNEIERAHKEYQAIQGAAGTTGAQIRESSIGGGAGAAALIKSIFFGR